MGNTAFIYGSISLSLFRTLQARMENRTNNNKQIHLKIHQTLVIHNICDAQISYRYFLIYLTYRNNISSLARQTINIALSLKLQLLHDI